MSRHTPRDELWPKITRGDDFVLIEALAPATYGCAPSPQRRGNGT